MALTQVARQRFWSNHPIDQTTCSICAMQLTEDNHTIDHIVPVSQGGTNSQANLRPACRECNEWKSDKLRLPNIVVGAQYARSLHAEGYSLLTITRAKIKRFAPIHLTANESVRFVLSNDPVAVLMHCYYTQPEAA